MENVLTCIQFPEDAAIHLDCYGKSKRTDWELLFRSLSSKLYHQTQGPFEVLRISIFEKAMRIGGWRDPNHELDLGERRLSLPEHNSKLVLTVNSNLPPSTTIYDVFLSFIEPLDLTTLRALVVTTGGDASNRYLSESRGSFWLQAFQRLTGLKVLRIHKQARVLLRALQSDDSLKMASTSAGGPSAQCLPTLLPQLESLVFENTEFKRYRGDPLPDVPYPLLLQACTARRRGGHGLKRLSIFRGVRILSSDIDALRQVVAEVIWDGEKCHTELDERPGEVPNRGWEVDSDDSYVSYDDYVDPEESHSGFSYDGYGDELSDDDYN